LERGERTQTAIMQQGYAVTAAAFRPTATLRATA
jgi:hypothetical protein